MTINRYCSEDAGAPALSGQVGALIAVLDAVLVDGYGSKDPLGWTIAYTDTNKRAYKMPAIGSSGRYLYIDDSGSHSVGARAAIASGFDSMSAIETGTGGFPGITTTTAFQKSDALNANARHWEIISDGHFFWLNINPEGNDRTYGNLQGFGDVPDPAQTDVATVLLPAEAATTAIGRRRGLLETAAMFGVSTSTNNLSTYKCGINNHFVGVGQFGRLSMSLPFVLTSTSDLNFRLLNTNGPMSSAFAPVLAGLARPDSFSDNVLIGPLPGLQCAIVSNSLSPGAIVDPGAGDDGRDYWSIRVMYGSIQSSVCIVDLTGPW